MRATNEGAFPEMEQAMWAWFNKMRDRGFPVSGPMLVEEATRCFPLVYRDLAGDKWEPTPGWLEGFKGRFNIRGLKQGGESMSADVPAARQYVVAFRQRHKDVGEYSVSSMCLVPMTWITSPARKRTTHG